MKTRDLEWRSDREFSLDGVRFVCGFGEYALRSDNERLVLLKRREDLENYASIFADAPPRRILEFGIFQGGSPALFSLWLDAEKVVGVDICAPIEAFDAFCRDHAAGRRISTHYGVSQTDRGRIHDIVRREFAAAPPDAIIDDASHAYGASRRTFEIAFPLLQPGGLYVIEDWGWAHWTGSRFYEGETALSMLIMELVMLCASRPDLVSEVRVLPSFAFIRKASDAPALSSFELSTAYRKRGVELIGARHANLTGLARIAAERFTGSVRRKVDRFRKRRRRV